MNLTAVDKREISELAGFSEKKWPHGDGNDDDDNDGDDDDDDSSNDDVICYDCDGIIPLIVYYSIVMTWL